MSGWFGRMELAGVVFLFLALGCQFNPGVSTRQLVLHRSLQDLSGLKPVEPVGLLNVSIAPPLEWDRLKPQKSLLYSHQQWRSPSHAIGVGVVYIQMPLPLDVEALVWFTKNEYARRESGGRMIGQWTDSLGRKWFEAENDKYHVRGYAVIKGLEAWIVYCGYKMKDDPPFLELALGIRCMETIVPGVLRP